MDVILPNIFPSCRDDLRTQGPYFQRVSATRHVQAMVDPRLDGAPKAIAGELFVERLANFIAASRGRRSARANVVNNLARVETFRPHPVRRQPMAAQRSAHAARCPD